MEKDDNTKYTQSTPNVIIPHGGYKLYDPNCIIIFLLLR